MGERFTMKEKTLVWRNEDDRINYFLGDKYIGTYMLRGKRMGTLYLHRDGNKHYFRKYDGFGINKGMADHVKSTHPTATVTVEIRENDLERVPDKCSNDRPIIIYKGSKISCDIQYLTVGMIYENRGEEQYIFMLNDNDMDFSEVEGELRSKQVSLTRYKA